MTEPKTVVLTLRVSPDVMARLTERAAALRQPVRRLAAMLIEDSLFAGGKQSKAFGNTVFNDLPQTPGDGVALNSMAHPKGPRVPRGSAQRLADAVGKGDSSKDKPLTKEQQLRRLRENNRGEK